MAPFFKSILEAQRDLTLSQIPHDFGILTNESAVHRARNQVVKYFLETDYERLFFIDSDIEFLSEDIGKIWALDADIGVGVYPMKKIEAKYAAWVNGHLLDCLEDYSAPIEVDYAGTGFMCIKRKVFEKMIPHIKQEKTGEGKRYRFFHFDNVTNEVELSEDYEFCRMAKDLGFKVIMDPSVRLKHYGLHGFG